MDEGVRRDLSILQNPLTCGDVVGIHIGERLKQRERDHDLADAAGITLHVGIVFCV